MLITSLIRRSPHFRPSSLKIVSRTYYKEGKHKIYTLDDLPVPTGRWKETHKANNAYYNKMLAGGIILFSSVVFIGYSTECINYRFRPPATYDQKCN